MTLAHGQGPHIRELPRPFLISPSVSTPLPFTTAPILFPLPDIKMPFPSLTFWAPALGDGQVIFLGQSLTFWAPVRASVLHAHAPPALATGTSLQPCPPALEGLPRHQPPRGGIPWLAENKGSGSRVPQPSHCSVSLHGPQCSPHSPSLPPLGAEGGPSLMLGSQPIFPS